MEPLKFTEAELDGMSRKDLQAHAKDHGLKANAKVFLHLGFGAHLICRIQF
jgi:hypothetical protein